MDPMILIFGGVAIVLLFILGSFMAALYQKVGPNTAMIVSGGGTQPKIIVGGGTVVLPLVNRVDYLSLEVMLIELESETPLFTKNGVPLLIEATAQVKVRGDQQSINTAAEQILGKTTADVQKILRRCLSRHLPSIVNTMTIEQLIRNSDTFSSRVAEIAITDLAKMGLTIVSFTVKEIRDTVGYLDALGKRNTEAALARLSSPS